METTEQDYPQTAAEFHKRFQNEEACWQYLVQLRWPDGFRCPACSSGKAWLNQRHCFECQKCHRQTSVTAGTIFQDTRKPLRLWFQVIWWVVGQKQGASALGLNRVIGIGSYKTAWTWMHKLRRAMVRPGRDRLAGTVEVDETYVGGSRPGKRGRGAENKTVVAVAAQVDGKGIGRIRLRRVQDASAVSLGGFVRESIVLGSNIVTDGWGSYESMDGYKHKARIIKDSQKSASTLLPRVHQVVSLFKRWLMGTHQGAVAAEHLDYYLDEFTFRFNRRTSRHRGKLFYRLIQQAVAVPPSPYREMIRGVRPKKRQKRKI